MLITCSNCQSKIRVPDSAAGKKGKCPKCGTSIAIPAAEEAAAEAPPEVAAEEPTGSPFDFSESAPLPRKSSRKSQVEDDEVVEEPADDEDESAPPKKKRKASKENTTLSLVSMILGILSLVCSCPSFVTWCAAPLPFLFAAAAIVTGFLGMKQGGRGMAITGICCGGGGMLLTIILVVVNIFLGVALFSMGAAGRH
jgi:predicted Zn finger-like uncharacterized protein